MNDDTTDRSFHPPSVPIVAVDVILVRLGGAKLGGARETNAQTIRIDTRRRGQNGTALVGGLGWVSCMHDALKTLRGKGDGRRLVTADGRRT
jgi:hypothetical protein